MKVDTLNMIYMILIALLFVSAFTYALYSVKGTIRRIKEKILSGSFSRAIDYWKYLLIKNYRSFEKYDIWRYCVHF